MLLCDALSRVADRQRTTHAGMRPQSTTVVWERVCGCVLEPSSLSPLSLTLVVEVPSPSPLVGAPSMSLVLLSLVALHLVQLLGEGALLLLLLSPTPCPPAATTPSLLLLLLAGSSSPSTTTASLL